MRVMSTVGSAILVFLSMVGGAAMVLAQDIPPETRGN